MKKLLIIIIVLLVVLVGGYVVYDQVLDKDESGDVDDRAAVNESQTSNIYDSQNAG